MILRQTARVDLKDPLTHLPAVPLDDFLSQHPLAVSPLEPVISAKRLELSPGTSASNHMRTGFTQVVRVYVVICQAIRS